MARRMFRYTVPIDDAVHVIPLTGSPVAVAVAEAGRLYPSVEFWAESYEDAVETRRSFQVVGTGQPLPNAAVWVGTCPRVASLVFHLYEVTGGDS